MGFGDSRDWDGQSAGSGVSCRVAQEKKKPQAVKLMGSLSVVL